MKSKKAVGMVAIIGFALLAIGIVVFFPIVKNLYGYITGSGDSASCAISLLGKGSVNCPVKTAVISSDKTTIDKDELLSIGEETSENFAKKSVAKLLSSCFNMGGGSSSRAFQTDNYVFSEAICVECYKLKIDKDAGNVEGLTEYMRNTKSSTSPEKSLLDQMSKDPEYLQAYMDYGFGSKLAPAEGTFVFNIDKEYTIFFMGIKKGTTGSIFAKIGNIANGEFLKSFFSNNDAYFAYAVESERLGQVCDRKVN